MADKERIMDFYYSENAAKRFREYDERDGGVHIVCRFKGARFVEQIVHGKNPLVTDTDMVLTGTGTAKDCTYA